MKHTLLVGNDINNINNSESWANLLESVQQFCGVQIENPGYLKPFPLFYEEIYLSAKREKVQKEFQLKQHIAALIEEIEPNAIHERIRNLPVEDIMTTNYDFTLEGSTPKKAPVKIRETKYSLFRHFNANGKRFWHLHGDIQKPSSITLGFEHYGGQLQRLRNYMATGTDYADKTMPKHPFVVRFRRNTNLKLYSWAELFFTQHVHILGLGLDFVETDLWWLLTFRSRTIHQGKIAVANTIYYYSPESRKEKDRAKLDLMKAMGVEVVFIDENNKETYYQRVIDRVEVEMK